MKVGVKAFQSIFCVAIALVVVAPSAQAIEPVRSFQIDVLPITTSYGTPVVTKDESQALIDKVNQGMNDSTGGVIKFTLRNVLPTAAPSFPVLSATDVGKVSEVAPKTDPSFEGVILIGVITHNPTLSFRGQAGGQLMLINGVFTREFAWVLTHEFGHNLNLLHANSATCTTQLPIVCTQYEYGDYSSTMGRYTNSYVANPYISRFSATELDRLKVLPANKRSYAVESGEYKLAPVYSTNLELPKVLYIPIGNEDAYSVEYRPAINGDGSLAQTQIYTSSGSYYTNITSYGMQLRIIRTEGTEYSSLLPKIENSGRNETALVVDSSTGPQVQPIGKTFTLSDGSTVTFVSADPNTGAVVKVVRTADAEAPKITSSTARWAYGTYYLGPNGERLIKRNTSKEWEFPVIEVPAKGVTDNRLIKTLQLEINGSVVDQMAGSAITQSAIFKYQTTDAGKFAVRLIATDYAGNSASTSVTNFESMYYKLWKTRAAINFGNDAKTSLILSFYKALDDVTYELTNLSSGTITSTTEKNNIVYITIEGIVRNSTFTAQLAATDPLGHTDGGQTISRAVFPSTCTNSECFVGSSWVVDTGHWNVGIGSMSLQENVKGKWITVQTAKPEYLNPSDKKYPMGFVLTVNYTEPGTHIYRLTIPATKKFKAYTGKQFKQIVKN